MGKTSLYASQIKNHFLKLLFPPYCYHCHVVHDKLGAPLCSMCLSYMEPRIESSRTSDSLIITFDKLSPARTLMAVFKQGAHQHLSSLLAACMAIHYAKSQLPLPDLITAVPTSRWRSWQTGHAAATTLAQKLAKLLESPFVPLLERRRQLFRQDLLSHEERRQLSVDDFHWRTPMRLKNKIVLLLDDTITTGTTLACCAERLWQAKPAQIIKMACVDQGYLQE